MTQKSPNRTDEYVGSRVRMRRLTLGMTQQRLGDELGLTFQQIQKYEKGVNRIGASRLQAISNILEVPVSFFFEGGPQPPGRARKSGEVLSPTYITDFAATADGHALIKAFIQIKEPTLRRSIVHMVEAIVERAPVGTAQSRGARSEH